MRARAPRVRIKLWDGAAEQPPARETISQRTEDSW